MTELQRHHVVDAARYFDVWLQFRTAAERLPGVQAAILHDGDVVLSTTHGVADIETGLALSDGHLFRIASHSKTFTATAVMQLVERGDLRLDDTVADRLPELAGCSLGAVTVREMLSHAGGVVRDGWDGDFWQLFTTFPDRDELLRIAADGAAAVAPPNERFKYSNVAYSLLGLVVEATSGLDFRTYVHRHIVEPLGLSDTGADLDPARADDYAAGHTALAHGDSRLTIDHIDTGAMSAATGVYSTATDTVRYVAAHFLGDDRLLADESKRQMQHAAWKIDGTESHYGLGFEIAPVGERRMLGHGGGYPGHITRTFFDAEDRLAVSVFTNAIDGPALGMATVAVKLVDLAAAEHGAPPPDGVDLDSYCGRFATLWGVYDVAALGGRLYQLAPSLVDPTVAPTRLEVIDADTLRIADTSGFGSFGETLTYRRAADGTVSSIRGGSGTTAVTLASFRATLAARADRRITLDDPLRPPT